MKAPVGASVRIYYDGRQLVTGDVLRTPTGRAYQVIGIRIQERGKRRGRQHLLCMVVDAPAPGANVVPLHWYKRGRS